MSWDKVCAHCSGKGTVYVITPFDPDDVSADICLHCNGDGGWDE